MATLASPQASARAGTLAALRYPDFRLYFIGQIISLSGSWMQIVAQGWLVFNLTKSEIWLGIVACAAGLPALLLSPVAGVIVDRLPRRNILIVSQSVQMLLALILAALTFSGTVQVWHIVTLAFFLGVVNAIDAPSRQTIIADLVDRESLTSGIAMNSIMFNGSRVIGPAAAGIALTQVGPAWCFLLNGLSFLAVIFMLAIIGTHPVEPQSEDFAPLARLKEGLHFARRHPTIAPLLLLAVTAAFLTGNISTLLPAFADNVLNSPKVAYAAMSTATGLGAVVAGIIMSPLGRRIGRGRVVVAMVLWVMISGLLVSQVASVDAAVLLMGFYGFGIILEFVTVNTLIQSEVPDAFRGRVLSLYTLNWFGIAPFGALLMGFVAGWMGTAATVGIAALLGGIVSVLIVLRYPQVRRLR